MLLALLLTRCGRPSPAATGHEQFAVGKDAWLALGAEGAEELRVADDGSLIASTLGDQERYNGDDRGPQVALWVNAETQEMIQRVKGWPVTSQPWPAPYVSTPDYKRYFVHIPGRDNEGRTLLVEPGGEWEFVGAFAVADNMAVLVIRQSLANAFDSTSETMFVRFRLNDGEVAARARMPFGALTPVNFVAPHAYLAGDKRQILLARTLEQAAVEVVAVATDTLQVAWRRELPMIDEGASRTEYPGALVACGPESSLVSVFVGKSVIERGIYPNAMYTLDSSGSIVAQRKFANSEFNSVRRIFVTGGRRVSVIDELNSRDHYRGAADIVDIDMDSGEKLGVRMKAPAAYHREDIWMTSYAWDSRRAGFWLAPWLLEDLKRVGVKLPPHLVKSIRATPRP